MKIQTVFGPPAGAVGHSARKSYSTAATRVLPSNDEKMFFGALLRSIDVASFPLWAMLRSACCIDWCCECFQSEKRSTDVVRFLHNHVAAMSLGFLSRVMLQSINVTSVLVGAMLQPAGVVKFLFGHVTASDVARFLLDNGFKSQELILSHS